MCCRRRGLFAALAAGLALCGCVNLAELSAGSVGCPEDEIEVSDDKSGFTVRTWTASCRSKRYFCSNRATASPVVGGGGGTLMASSVQCTPEVGGRQGEDVVPLPATSGGSTAVRPTAARPTHGSSPQGVTRIKASAGHWMIGANLAATPFALELQGAPAKEAQRLWLVLYGRATGLDEKCTPRFMIDGELLELEQASFKRRAHEPVWSVPVELELIERIAEAERSTGRVCDQEFRLDDAAKAVLREYVTRFREELSWGK
ncbi:MAG: hypothetical protein OEZ06_30035 [Myxococcales bacterium]|nr:hypothetical protein [Myxococcales bacterium]